MASKSRGRELAVQVLYQLEFSGYSLPKTLTLFWQGLKADNSTRQHVEDLVESVIERKSELDQTITSYLKNWSMERVVSLDRIVLRLGFYELIYAKDIPWRVVVDEAVTLAKMFSDEKSAHFINGILHAWVTQHQNEIADRNQDAPTVAEDAQAEEADADEDAGLCFPDEDGEEA